MIAARYISVTMVMVAMLFSTVPSALAASLAEVSLPDKSSVGGKDVVLNGLGLRTATMLKVKVYVIGLYLENKSNNPEDIMASSQTKSIRMEFVREVEAVDIRQGWSEGIKDNYADHTAVQQQIDTFNASMRDMKKGDSILLDFVGDTVNVTVNGSNAASLEGRAFQEALLSIWLGKIHQIRTLGKDCWVAKHRRQQKYRSVYHCRVTIYSKRNQLSLSDGQRLGKLKNYVIGNEPRRKALRNTMGC